ncbi:MAG TPA: hypothetical protein VLJ11_22225 [Bryobacteraceae bacterium]|nr:hypothetical protein [Bryobacteraceae bacterium]
MGTGQKDETARRTASLGLFLAGATAIFTSGLAAVSGLKTLGEHPTGFSAQLLQFASPVIRFLQGKTLWDLVPAIQPDRPLGLPNLLFWVCVGILGGTIRIALTSRRDGRNTVQDSLGELWGALWRTPLARRGAVTHYTVMFNGPVTNPQFSQGAVPGPALDLIAADLQRLMQAVANEGLLPDEKKKDACDLLNTIAQEAKRPARERKPAVVKAVLNAIPLVISTAKSLVDLWTEIQPHLISFFM